MSNKRIFYCEPGNLGITMNFKDISWKSIKEVSFKEEFFGSKFICVPQHGENIVTEFIPKVQARKLYQAAYEQLESLKNNKDRRNWRTEGLLLHQLRSMPTHRNLKKKYQHLLLLRHLRLFRQYL